MLPFSPRTDERTRGPDLVQGYAACTAEDSGLNQQVVQNLINDANANSDSVSILHSEEAKSESKRGALNPLFRVTESILEI